MTVYHRPQPKNVPIRYQELVEKAAKLVHNHSIAIYTSKMAPNQGPVGPPGPPGEDQNSWYDTIIASASDEYSPVTVGGPKTNFRAPYPLDLQYVRVSLTTAPVGAAFIVDVHMDGISLFSTLVHIDDGSKTSVGSATPSVLAHTYARDDAEFEVYVTQVGSVIAGTGIKVAITGIKRDPL